MTDCADRFMQETNSKCVWDVIKNIVSDSNCDQPFYVADLADIVNKFRVWRAKLPQVHPFYAVKCNPDPLVLKLMVSLGIHFDCASKSEIDTVLTAGAKPSEIIYAHPYKSRTFLRHAASLGVDLMTFDSESELIKVKATFPEARLVIRLRIPNVSAGFVLNNKFGCDFGEAYHLLDVARKLQLNVVGLSFHVGSLCSEPAAFAKAIWMARQVFDIAEKLGFHFSLLDLGGGFPGHSDSYDLFDEMCHHINRALKEHFSEDKGLRIIAEPGCYFVCSAFTLCVTINGRRDIKPDIEDDTDDGKPLRMYFLNDGIYGSFSEGFEKYGYRMKPLLSQSELRHRPLMPTKLWGCTCCSLDCVLENCLLPEMEVGESIVFENMGAYCLSLATTFNGFLKPNTRYVFTARNKFNMQCLPSWDATPNESLAMNDLKSFIKMKDYVCVDDSNTDLYRKG